jgi:alkaline phosphatase D
MPLTYQPQLFLFAGDNVYGDVRNGRDVPDGELIQSLQESYAQAARVPGMARLRSTIPHLATWDDHDYGKNDAGAEFAGRHEAQQLFLQFWDVPLTDVRHQREGIYHSQTFGPSGQRVQVILLDTRFFRSPLKPTDQRNAAGRERYLPDEDPGKTMLGEAQWSWLAERLREPADVRLIVSSPLRPHSRHWCRWCDPAVRRSPRRWPVPRDHGRALPPLRDHLERHQPGLSRQPRGRQEVGPNRLGAVFGAPNFGTLDVDWWECTVTLSLRSENGEPVRRQVVRLDELTVTNP